MTDEELTKITDSMQDKLGTDNSALIADDIGSLITANATTQKTLRERDDEIAKLKADKEKLILANFYQYIFVYYYLQKHNHLYK